MRLRVLLVFCFCLTAPTGRCQDYGYYGDPYYGSYGGFRYWEGPYYPGPIILPPLVIPAETLYGPQVMRQFMGPLPQTSTQVHIIRRPISNDADAGKPKVRISNPEAKAQAVKFLAFGDAQFVKQNFNSALERYKLAVQSAPDLAEGYLKQGFALVAIGSYESAARVMRRGLQVLGNPNRIDFDLAELYGANVAAKRAHLDALAQAADDNPQSPDLLLLLGLQLDLDGQADRAAPLFRRCEQLGGNDDGSLTEILKRAKQKAAAPAGREI